jgi:membrane-associated protein TcaA
MKFCAKCGSKLENGKNFCPKCGFKVSTEKDNLSEDKIDDTGVGNITEAADLNEIAHNAEASDSNEFANNSKIINNTQTIKNKSGISKKAKLSIVAIIAIIVIFIGLYIVGSLLAKPANVVQKFQSAVSSNNAKELANTLYSTDSRLKIDEKNVAPLLTYFKENPSYLNTVVKNLNQEALTVNQSKDLSGTTSNGALNLECISKKFLFFPDYKIVIKPAFIEVNTGIKDVTISLDGTEIGKSDSDNYSREFGPYIPGKYKLTANYKGNYVTLSEPHDIDFISDSNDKVNVDIFTNINYINVKSEYPDAELFVNGKDTGVKVADAQNFGPLSSNTKIYATYTKDGITLKSNEYTLSPNDNNVDLSFAAAEDLVSSAESNIKNLMGWYTYYFAEAVNTNNFKMVSDYLYPGSKLYNEQMSYIPTAYNRGIKESIMSYNVISYKLSDDYKSGSINTEEVYNVDNNGQSSIKTFKYTYTFKYNETVRGYQLDTIDTKS